MAAATLIIVAIFFMPVYLKNKIYTMPQFLNQRYNHTVAMIMAVFWLLLYIVVNLMSILYLGALAISSISGFNIYTCILALAVFAIFITLGGMKVIGYTDVIQVAVLIGGMWIANLNYWGCNQYITQRALGANLPTARNGLLFAAFLKLLMPVIVILPGIAAYYLHQKGMFQTEMLSSKGVVDVNKAYPSLLTLLPAGLKGLSFAALTAAIVASLAGKANSISTIFVLDIYKKALHKDASEQRLVRLGRVVVIISMILAILLSLALGDALMGEGKQGFQYIQEYTGFVSPGIFAMFIFGFFWKKATSNAALFATIGGFIFSVILKFLPMMMNLSFLAPIGFSKDNGTGVYEIPFLDRMSIVFILCVIGMVLISNYENRKGVKPHGLEVDKTMFKVSTQFAVGSLIVTGILIALYIFYW